MTARGRRDAFLSGRGESLIGWQMGGVEMLVDMGIEGRGVVFVCSGGVVAETDSTLRV